MNPTIRVIDFETTGLDMPAEVIEVGLCDVVQIDGKWSVQEPGSWLCEAALPITPGARSAHHITADEIAGHKSFDADGLWNLAADSGVTVIAAHNLDYEAQFWGPPKLRTLCTLKAALRIWPDAPSHSNGTLRYWLEDQGLIQLQADRAQPAHRAGPDAYVTAHILRALLAHATASEMVAWTKEPRLLPTCPIGKFRGKPWPEVEAGFLSWMLGQATMEADLKWNAQRELDRRSA